jgi:DNA helicase II / ATP-dependent DNA helicase PcrA
LKVLTREQKKVVKSFSQLPNRGSLLLIAGAGTGKTLTLLAVLENILKSTPSSRVALISFSRKSANELRERAKVPDLGFCGTFHSLAYRLLREINSFSVLENSDQIKLSILHKLFPRKYFLLRESDSFTSILSDFENYSLFTEYQRYKDNNGLVDYDDLIQKAASQGLGKSSFDCLLVDEFQDLSYTQLDWLKKLQFNKLFAVGDDWQSIYGFRGASVTNILDFQSHFLNVHQLKLTKNFRSHRRITNLGNKIIKNCTQVIRKKLTAKRFLGAKPILLLYKSEDRVAIINNIKEYLKRKFPKDSFQWLTRTNRAASEIKHATSDEVRAITIHAAKGLEFKNVLLFTLEKSEFPSSRADINEEIRLFYVAVTRAKNRLVFCGSYGFKKSPFLDYLTGHVRVRQIA